MINKEKNQVIQQVNHRKTKDRYDIRNRTTYHSVYTYISDNSARARKKVDNSIR